MTTPLAAVAVKIIAVAISVVFDAFAVAVTNTNN